MDHQSLPYLFPFNFFCYQQENPLNTYIQHPSIENSYETDYYQTLKNLQTKTQQLQDQISFLSQENKKLKKQIKPKRKYSQRRTNLRKQFSCPFKGCEKNYSSKIALRSHLKQKHEGSQEDIL